METFVGISEKGGGSGVFERSSEIIGLETRNTSQTQDLSSLIPPNLLRLLEGNTKIKEVRDTVIFFWIKNIFKFTSVDDFITSNSLCLPRNSQIKRLAIAFQTINFIRQDNESTKNIGKFSKIKAKFKNFEIIQEKNIRLELNKGILFVERFSEFIKNFELYFLPYPEARVLDFKNILKIVDSGLEPYFVSKILENIEYCNIFVKFLDFLRNIKSKEKLHISGIGALFYLYKYILEYCNQNDLISFKLDILQKVYGIEGVRITDIEAFEKSYLKDVIINEQKSVEIKKILISIFLSGCKFWDYSKKKSILTKYLLNQNNLEKLEKIQAFFGKNTVSFSEEEFIFIFENDLYNTKFVDSQEFISKIISWSKLGIKVEDIKKLTSEQVDVLSNDVIGEVVYLIELFLSGPEKHKEYLLFSGLIVDLKEKLKYLQVSFPVYDILQDACEAKFSQETQVFAFAEILQRLYKEWDIDNIVINNKALIALGIGGMDGLNEYFDSLKNIEINICYGVFFAICDFQNGDREFLKNLIKSLKGSEEDYEKLLDKAFLKKILRNREWFDLYVADGENQLSFFFELVNIADNEKNLEKKPKSLPKTLSPSEEEKKDIEPHENIEPTNDADKFIISCKTSEEKEKIGEYLAGEMESLFRFLDPRIHSSTNNKTNGTGTGRTTNLLRTTFFRNLQYNQEKDTSFEKYFDRIFLINPSVLLQESLPDEGGGKKALLLSGISNNGYDKKYGFFEGLHKILEILEEYGELNDRLDLTALRSLYSEQINSIQKSFEAKFCQK